MNDSHSDAPHGTGEASPPPPPPPPGPTGSSSRVDILPANAPRRSLPSGRLMAIVGGILVLVGAVAWAGMSMLGSDEDESEPAATVPVAAEDEVKDRFIARGDKLCARANRRQEALLIPDSPAGFGPYLEKVRGVLVGLISDLKKLPQPKQDRALLGKMYAQVDKLPPLLTEAQAAAAAGDLGGMERIIGRGERIEHRANALALQYGFIECSQP